MKVLSRRFKAQVTTLLACIPFNDDLSARYLLLAEPKFPDRSAAFIPRYGVYFADQLGRSIAARTPIEVGTAPLRCGPLISTLAKYQDVSLFA